MNKRKYYMRGLGFGILITTVILMVSNSRNKLTDANAIQRVKDLGYEIVQPEEKKNMNLSEMKDKLSGTPVPSSTPTLSVTKTPDDTMVPQVTTPEPLTTGSPETGGPTPYVYKDEKGVQGIRLIITDGMTFEEVFDILQSNGIASDKVSFFELVEQLSADERLKKGTYNLVETMSNERLVRILTGAEPDEN